MDLIFSPLPGIVDTENYREKIPTQSNRINKNICQMEPKQQKECEFKRLHPGSINFGGVFPMIRCLQPLAIGKAHVPFFREVYWVSCQTARSHGISWTQTELSVVVVPGSTRTARRARKTRTPRCISLSDPTMRAPTSFRSRHQVLHKFYFVGGFVVES